MSLAPEFATAGPAAGEGRVGPAVPVGTALSTVDTAMLLHELALVEGAIRRCEPVFTVTGTSLAVSDRLIELTVREHAILAEITRRVPLGDV